MKEREAGAAMVPSEATQQAPPSGGALLDLCGRGAGLTALDTFDCGSDRRGGDRPDGGDGDED